MMARSSDFNLLMAQEQIKAETKGNAWRGEGRASKLPSSGEWDREAEKVAACYNAQ